MRTCTRFAFAAATTALLCLALPHPARADHGWGLLASYWDTSDLGGGPGIGAKFSFQIVPYALWDLRGAFYPDVGEDDLELEVMPFETGLSFVHRPSNRLDLFGGLGVGYYQYDAVLTSAFGPEFELDPDGEAGFYFSAGAEYTLSENVEEIMADRATVYAEFMYRITEVQGLQNEDVSLDGPVLNLGLMLRW